MEPPPESAECGGGGGRDSLFPPSFFCTSLTLQLQGFPILAFLFCPQKSIPIITDTWFRFLTCTKKAQLQSYTIKSWKCEKVLSARKGFRNKQIVVQIRWVNGGGIKSPLVNDDERKKVNDDELIDEREEEERQRGGWITLRFLSVSRNITHGYGLVGPRISRFEFQECLSLLSWSWILSALWLGVEMEWSKLEFDFFFFFFFFSNFDRDKWLTILFQKKRNSNFYFGFKNSRNCENLIIRI